ncbi:hypothetical protein OG520_00955 [Streptomyces sp. NBC_00984]|uniref:hypothetical protein n=1 Tax=Streptomyces sp. NBC_00984 TaxID=2903700 RepID=UPI00386D3CBD|nr:hypothetical protein OG520_00955 [Streptomyces sp. NBC_00984]
MAQIPVGDGDPYGVIRVLGGAQRSVGNHEREVGSAGSACVRAQQAVKDGGRAEYFATLAAGAGGRVIAQQAVEGDVELCDRPDHYFAGRRLEAALISGEVVGCDPAQLGGFPGAASGHGFA